MNEKNDQFVTEWVLNTVKENYKDDIALVVAHNTLRIDPEPRVMSYFVPCTKRGETLARTFILDGVGYDIWGVSWARLEGFAGLSEYNITVLADGEILYARTEEDRERFKALQRLLFQNLADRAKMRSCALEAYAQAKTLYTQMLFAEGCDVRLGAGYVLDYLARAIAFTNHRYFRFSQTEQLKELKSMTDVPDGFAALYQSVIREKSESGQKELCFRLMCIIQDFLLKASPDEGCDQESPREQNFQDLADWYGELSYTWLRLRHYAACGDAMKVYMWGIMLQDELNQICGDFGLEKMCLMDAYDADDLAALAARADLLEKKVRDAILQGGGRIHEYATPEEFLHEA